MSICAARIPVVVATGLVRGLRDPTMPGFIFFPVDDPQRGRFIRRYLMAVGASAMVVFLFFAAFLADVLSMHGLINAALLTLFFVVAFYVVFRSGLNLRFSDPSLTIPQILSSTLVTLYVLYESKDGHGVLSMIYLVSFTFGVVRLSTRQLLALTAFTAVSYALLIGWQWHADPDPYLLKRKVLTWIALISVLAFFSVIGGYVSKLRKDVADSRKRLEAAMLQVQNMAARDELTGVFNRRTLADVLNVHKNRADRYGTIFSVLMLDIDHFKRVNDTYGHQNGDRVLKAFAAAISSGLRSTDILGRYGGEEFLAVLDQTPLGNIPVAAARLCALAREINLDEIASGFRISVSVGGAQYRKTEDWQATIERADQALYRAKDGGRDRFEMEFA